MKIYAYAMDQNSRLQKSIPFRQNRYNDKVFKKGFNTSYYNKFFETKKKTKKMSIIRDFLSGTLSGFAQVFIMQPFEIIKVRLANQSIKAPEYAGIIDCFKKIMSSDGFTGFYKGTFVIN